MKTISWMAVTAIVMFLFAGSSSAGEARKAERKGPLAGLPSAPGAHLAKVKALGDNQWLELGSPKADPKWGKACGRSWSPRAAFAPDLGGAFFFGEGPHGMVKPNGRYMDDLWFYDVNAHRWVCVYPGIDVKKYGEIKLNKDGFESTPDGNPLPIASMVHAYSMITYDTGRKLFMSVPCPGAYWKRIEGRKAFFTKNKGKVNEKRAGPWIYDTVRGRWDRARTATARPRSSFGATLIYVPTVRKCFFYWRTPWDMYWYDGEKKTWTKIKDKGPRPPFGYDSVSCYDSKRDRIYIGGGQSPPVKTGNSLWVFDVKTAAWIDPKPKGTLPPPVYTTHLGMIHYDSVSDAVVLIFHRPVAKNPKMRGVFAYHPAKNEWTMVSEEPPAVLLNRRVMKTGFYDPKLGVHFLHAAGDGRPNGSMWVYRYKRAGKK